MTGLLCGAGRGGRGIAALLLNGLGIWFQISCLGRLAGAGHTRGLPKRAWEIIIVPVPTFGGILYLLFGRADSQVSPSIPGRENPWTRQSEWPTPRNARS
jgi:hypothetical protein